MSQPLTFPFKFHHRDAPSFVYTAVSCKGEVVAIIWDSIVGGPAEYYQMTVERFIADGTWVKVTE